MKGVRLLEYGGQLVLNDVPTPAIARDEVLVKIKSTTVNIWILLRPPEQQDSNSHRMPGPPSLPRQAATMRRTSTPSAPAG